MLVFGRASKRSTSADEKFYKASPSNAIFGALSSYDNKAAPLKSVVIDLIVLSLKNRLI